MMIKEGKNPDRVNEPELAAYRRKVAFKHIKENPMLFAKLYIRGIINVFVEKRCRRFSNVISLRDEEMNFINPYYRSVSDVIKELFAIGTFFQSEILLLVETYLFISYLLWVTALFIMKNNKPAFYFCLFVIVYSLLLAGGGPCRYRIPLIPFTLLFVGVGGSYYVEKIIRLFSRRDAGVKL